jgi:hypothetical protein
VEYRRPSPQPIAVDTFLSWLRCLMRPFISCLVNWRGRAPVCRMNKPIVLYWLFESPPTLPKFVG